MTFDPDAYTMTIRRENVDGDLLYVGRIAEFPNISAYEETYEEAREILLDAIQTLKAIADENGSAFPSPNPILSEEYSGRPSLRLPKSLHAKTVRLAELEGVSLNTYLVTAIASYAGEAQGLSWAAKEVAKNVQAAFYLVSKTAKLLTSMPSTVSMEYGSPSPSHFYLKGISLIEATNDG